MPIRIPQTTHHIQEVSQKGAVAIAKYLQTVHRIQVPENFTRLLVRYHNVYHSHHGLTISRNILNSIVEGCRKWQEYVPKNHWDTLVCKEVLTFAKIRTSVLEARYITAHGIPLVKTPPAKMTTVVTATGTLECFQ